MASTVNIYYHWEVPLNGVIVGGGSSAVPITVSLTGDIKHDATYSVGATSKVLLNVGNGATDDIADFDIVVITSSIDGWVEIVGTAQADNSTFPIKAGIPLFIGYSANGTKAYNALGDFAGASQNITKISIKTGVAGPAAVRIVALT